MRIIQMVQKPQRRGPEILANQLNKAFEQRGHVVRIIYLYPYRGDQPLPVARGDVALDGKEHHVFEKVPGFHPGLLQQVMAHLRQFQPDIVQVNGSRTVKYGAFAKRLSRTRTWSLVYRNIDNPVYWVRNSFYRWFYRRMVMPQMDGVIGVSQGILDTLRQMYEFKVPTIYIPYVVDPIRLEPVPSQREARQQLGVPQSVPVVLFMGNLSAQKRPDRFVRVIEQVHRQVPEAEAWILGDGPLRSQVSDQVRALGLEDRVRFYGYQAHVSPYIAGAELLLVTSDSDGIPTVVQEAGYLAKPTVATRVGGLQECIADGETGLLFDRDDEQGLSKGVVSLLKDPNKRIVMGHRAQRLVRHEFTLDKVVDKHLEFYAAMLASKT